MAPSQRIELIGGPKCGSWAVVSTTVRPGTLLSQNLGYVWEEQDPENRHTLTIDYRVCEDRTAIFERYVEVPF